jgi:UTP--glucose-1-phosphate uridylyltransferase
VLVEQAGTRTDLSVMAEHFLETGHAQIMVEPVPEESVSQYGVVDLEGVEIGPGEGSPMRRVVEKPPRDEAPSNLAIVGRYVLPARIFQLLDTTKPGAGGEIQLTDAIATLMTEAGVDAFRIRGRSYDCGSKLGYLEATVAYGVKHPKLGSDFRELLKQYQ